MSMPCRRDARVDKAGAKFTPAGAGRAGAGAKRAALAISVYLNIIATLCCIPAAPSVRVAAIHPGDVTLAHKKSGASTDAETSLRGVRWACWAHGTLRRTWKPRHTRVTSCRSNA